MAPFFYLITYCVIKPSFYAGSITSFLHVVSGPDHLAAVTPLSVKNKKRAWQVGLFWGMGHLTGIAIIGGLFLLFKESIPVESISSFSEKLVGWLLIGMGLWGYYRLLGNRIHSNSPKKASPKHRLSSFGIGVLHGLAGVSHFILLLPLLSFDHFISGILYLLGFALGTVSAMTLYAYLIGKTSHWAGSHKHWINGIRFVAASFAFIIGVYWLKLSH